MSEHAQAMANSILQATRFLEMEAKFVAFINDKTQLDAQWRALDFNGNGIVSLAELDKWIVQSFPQLNNKAALRRAFIRTTSKDGDGDDWIQRREFKALLVNVIYFNRAFELFDSIDTGRDQRVDFDEFFSAVSRLGLGLDRKQALSEFQRIDVNGGGQLLFDEFCEWLVEINSFKFKERMRGTAYVESIANGTSPKADVKQSPAPSIRSRALASPSNELNSAASVSSAEAFDHVESQFVRFISSREQLITQWSELDSSSHGVVSFAAFQMWLSRHFPVLNDPSALKLAFERVYGTGGESAQLQFKDFGAILVNVLFFCRAIGAYKDCKLSLDKAVDLRDFKSLITSLKIEMANHAEVLSQFRTVDSNDSGDISFTEFSIWLVHRLGPHLMQKISDSVQYVMSTQDKVPATPEITNGSRVSQVSPMASPAFLLGSGPVRTPPFVSTPPHSYQLAGTPVGKDSSPTVAYFSLQIGINYTGSSAPLAGCVNDIRGWADLFRSVGCSFNIHIVCSDEDARISSTERQRSAKKSDILSAMQDIHGAMIASESSHKFLFLNFSGHGVQEIDRSGDEEDGLDECLAPSDHEVAGYISDDYLSKWLCGLPQHTCFAVFDCCHSGTCLDLKDVPNFLGFFASGCSDHQESADVESSGSSANGALTKTLQTLLLEQPSISFEHLRQEVVQRLQRSGFTQSPILECTLSHQSPVLSGWISSFESASLHKVENENLRSGAARSRSVYPVCSICSQPPTSLSNISAGTCVTCHLYLCPLHVSLHRKQKSTSEHTIFSFAEVTDDSLKIRTRALPDSAAPAISAEELQQRRASVGSALSLSGCALEVVTQAARTLDIVHESLELQCSRARSAIEASATAAAAAFNTVLQRQRTVALQVVESYHDSQVGTIAELQVALQEHSTALETLMAETNSALEADPGTAMMSTLFIPALTSASFEGQSCAKAAFSVHRAQNETNVVFMPRTIQVFDEAVTLGEIVISGQHKAFDATDATTKPLHEIAAGRENAPSEIGDVPNMTEGQGDAFTSNALEDIDMKSWNSMTSQKRSKAIEALLRRQLGEWKPPALAKKGNSSSATKMRPTTLEAPPTVGTSTKKAAPPPRPISRGGGTA